MINLMVGLTHCLWTMLEIISTPLQTRSIWNLKLETHQTDRASRSDTILVNGNFLKTWKKMFWRAGMQAQDILLGGIHTDVPPKQPVCKLRGAHSSPKQHSTSLFASFACFLPCMVVLFPFTSHAHARLFQLWSPTVKRAFTFSTASQHDSGIVVGHELLLSNPLFFLYILFYFTEPTTINGHGRHTQGQSFSMRWPFCGLILDSDLVPIDWHAFWWAPYAMSCVSLLGMRERWYVAHLTPI